MIETLLIKSFLLSIATFIMLKLLIPNGAKLGLMDVPNNRSSHKLPVVRGAGIVFGFTFLVGIIAFYYYPLENPLYLYTFLSLVIVYATGFYDDIYEITSRKKFIFIIIATGIACYDGFNITSLGNYFGYELTLGYLSVPFTIFAIVGFTNAINLTDGLDGLAGSISVIILSGLLYIGLLHDDYFLISLTILSIGPLLVFLYFNWYPAKVFMGDSGSLFLGFFIALLSIYALKYVTPSSILFLAAIPLLDTLIVMRRRKQRKQSLFVADKNHLHHILLNFKKDKLFTVFSLLKLQVIFTLIFVQVYDKPDIVNMILFGVLFMVFFNLFDPRMNVRRKLKTKS